MGRHNKFFLEEAFVIGDFSFVICHWSLVVSRWTNKPRGFRGACWLVEDDLMGIGFVLVLGLDEVDTVIGRQCDGVLAFVELCS